MSGLSSPQRVLRFDVFELDLHAGELRKQGLKLRLRGQPLQVLATLLQRAGDLVTREEIRAEVWPADTFVDFDHSLHNAIARIRETLGDSAETPTYIETVPRRGYRFLKPVRAAVPQESALAPRVDRTADARQVQAVAVLPLEDLSAEPGSEYFADGMTEALITSLAKIKALRVISRTSAMQYKGARKSLPQIARELNVDAVIEGSVTRAGERVRITTQLIHADTDQHLWAESYERDFRDLLSLQGEIARQVANDIRVVITPEETMRLGGARQVIPEAHDWYLRARYHWNKRTEDSVRRALSFFQRAIDCDPTYAQGYAGLADCYNILGYYNALPPDEAYPKGKAASLKALELDDSLAEPHATLGVVKRDYDWDWPGAEAEFQRAIELNPGYAEAFHWRSTLLSLLGRHSEAIREKQRALAMDPLSVVIRTDLGRMFYFARDYVSGAEHYRAAIDMDPNFASAHLGLAQVLQQEGRVDESICALETGARLAADSRFALAKLGHGYALAGRLDEARALLRRLQTPSDRGYVSPFDIALVHVGLREADEALICLDQAFDQRSLWLGYLNVEPQFALLRPDSRFQELLGRIGLLPAEGSS